MANVNLPYVKPLMGDVGQSSTLGRDVHRSKEAAFMLNTIGNTLNFFLNQIGDNDVTEIFKKAENTDTETEYAYTEQKGIVGKPSIVATNTGLQRYSLPVKLHFQYCNPTKIIKGLKELAEKHQIISYFQDDEYKGEFVITKIVESPKNHYKDNLLYAEITVDLLEYPIDPDEEYTPNANPNKSWLDNLMEDKAPLVAEPVKKATGAINSAVVQTVADAALDFALGQTKSYVKSGTGGLL